MAQVWYNDIVVWAEKVGCKALSVIQEVRLCQRKKCYVSRSMLSWMIGDPGIFMTKSMWMNHLIKYSDERNVLL